MMSARETENLRRAILNVLDANKTRFGLGLDGVTLFVSNFGFQSIESKTVEPEIQYLAEKGLVGEIDKTVSPENRRWRITAAGRDFIAQGAA